jgi:hypothetical protein
MEVEDDISEFNDRKKTLHQTICDVQVMFNSSISLKAFLIWQ